jgi:hypothetical protein
MEREFVRDAEAAGDLKRRGQNFSVPAGNEYLPTEERQWTERCDPRIAPSRQGGDSLLVRRRRKS